MRSPWVTHYSAEGDDEDEDSAGHPMLSPNHIAALSDALGREVIALDTLPYEATGHIDLWAKIVAHRKVLVASLSFEDLNAAYPEGVPSWIKRVRKFYNKQADRLTELGFEVVRLRSPVPDRAFGQYRFRSYLNSLQIGQRLLVPRYVVDRQEDPDTTPYIDAALLPAYEQSVEDVLAQHGFEVSWVPQDYAILGDGAVHCQTMQIAADLAP